MLRRLEVLPDFDDTVRQRAVSLLSDRLSEWLGSSTPSERSIDEALVQTKEVRGDPAELMIARAIATTVDPAAFGVSRRGAAYNLRPKSEAADTDLNVFVGGLSPLLDGAALLFRMTSSEQETYFFEKNGRFFTSGRTLFVFTAPPAPSWWRRTFNALQFWNPGAGGIEISGLFAPARTVSLSDDLKQFAPEADTDGLRAAKVRHQVRIDLPNPGVLQQMGYKVGKSGLNVDERRAVLKRVFSCELESTAESRSYVAEWGPPSSQQRLDKMIRCLSTFIDKAERRSGDYSVAIDDWTDDLEWLRRSLS
jgi:hypothetical protein